MKIHHIIHSYPFLLLNIFTVLRLFLVLFHGFLWAWWQWQLPLSGVEDHLPLSAPAVHLLWAGLHFALFVRTARAAAAAGVWHCCLQTMQFPWFLKIFFFFFVQLPVSFLALTNVVLLNFTHCATFLMVQKVSSVHCLYRCMLVLSSGIKLILSHDDALHHADTGTQADIRK